MHRNVFKIFQCNETLFPFRFSLSVAWSRDRLSSLADGEIKVFPIAICVDTTDMRDYPNGYIAVTKIRFKDGTEYLVRYDVTANYMFAVGDTDRDVTFLFNRMIDVNEISSVILDGGLEFSVS